MVPVSPFLFSALRFTPIQGAGKLRKSVLPGLVELLRDFSGIGGAAFQALLRRVSSIFSILSMV